MKLTGKTQKKGNDVLLKEVAMVCNIKELDEIIDFLVKTRNDLAQTPNLNHDDVLALKEDIVTPHRHLNLTNANFKKSKTDIVVYVPFKVRKTEEDEVIWEDMNIE